jgi:hypothetical protein
MVTPVYGDFIKENFDCVNEYYINCLSGVFNDVFNCSRGQIIDQDQD